MLYPKHHEADMNDIVCVSGGFDPLHTGHLEMFHEAAGYGRLTVILNSDAWLLRKKGFVFMPWEQRAAIIGELRYVHHVVAVDDDDGSVCEALARIRPRYFANGGDRKSDNTPEVSLCRKLGIEMLWQIGGNKAASSSDIARRAWVSRPWGQYVTLDEGDGYKVKKVVVNPGQSISLQFHRHRREYWFMTGDDAQVQLGDRCFDVKKGTHPVVVEKETVHRLSNTGNTPLVVIEIQSGAYLEEDDIIRITEASQAA